MIVCKKCGAVDDYRTEQKSNNLVAYCNTCLAYIKNIPHDKPKLWVGKYKGQEIAKIDDLPYLEWAEKTLTVTQSVKQAMKDKIKSLRLLML